MKKIFLIVTILMVIAVGFYYAQTDFVNKCPSSPYGNHDWKTSNCSINYYIEECEYCHRHRRNWYDSDFYEYENMKTGGLSIKVPKNKVNR